MEYRIWKMEKDMEEIDRMKEIKINKIKKIARLRLSCDSYCTIDEGTKLL